MASMCRIQTECHHNLEIHSSRAKTGLLLIAQPISAAESFYTPHKANAAYWDTRADRPILSRRLCEKWKSPRNEGGYDPLNTLAGDHCDMPACLAIRHSAEETLRSH
ncbi:hypothetical protein H107_02956 [Trichophyton rubrum CBS 202.88]|nr:hypothetical protein H107_02956 [Trichophyton rubrum CBS 202.88]